MNRQPWRNWELGPGILRENVPDDRSLTVWLPAESTGGRRQWERIGTVAGSEFIAAQGLGAVLATSLCVVEQTRSVLAKLFGWFRRASNGQMWLLPNGTTAEQQGARRADLILAWGTDEGPPVDEARVRSRWPSADRVQRLGKNLVVAFGVQPAATSPASTPPPSAPEAHAEQLLEVARGAGDRRREVLALTDLGAARFRNGKAAQAVDVLEEALRMARELDDRALEQDVLSNLGVAFLRVGDPHRALELLNQSLDYARAAEDRFAEKTTLERVGHVFSRLGNKHDALGLYQQALNIARDVGDRQQEADLHWHIAIQYAELGQRNEAIATAETAVHLQRAVNVPAADTLAQHLQKYMAGDARDGLATALPTPLDDETMFDPGPVGFAGATARVGPSLLRMALSVAKSMAKFVGSGFKTVSPSIQHKRLQTCAMCEHHTGARCRVCGCFTSLKSRLPHENCPLGRWPSPS